MNVSIIGTGLQFSRRAPVVINSKDDKLVSICGVNSSKVNNLAKQYKCNVDLTWTETVNRNDVDIIIITTPPHLHNEITIAALAKNKHILCEKPLSREVLEAETMYEKSLGTNVILKCGFNHRHHPAMLEAKKLINDGCIGELMFGRAVYGICGRPEYKDEWRANPQQAAGGQFIEQGSHLIDLYRWYFGEIEYVSAMTDVDYFKDQALDDGGFAIFKFQNGATGSMHTSLAQWINTFVFEIYGTDGYIKIDGLGGGYGDHKMTFGKRDFDLPFSEKVTFFRGADKSWVNEWSEFKTAIKTNNKNCMGNAYDGFQAMKVAKACYESSSNKKFIFMK